MPLSKPDKTKQYPCVHCRDDSGQPKGCASCHGRKWVSRYQYKQQLQLLTLPIVNVRLGEPVQ